MNPLKHVIRQLDRSIIDYKRPYKRAAKLDRTILKYLIGNDIACAFGWNDSWNIFACQS